jgi:hypothetical protein
MMILVRLLDSAVGKTNLTRAFGWSTEIDALKAVLVRRFMFWKKIVCLQVTLGTEFILYQYHAGR